MSSHPSVTVWFYVSFALVLATQGFMAIWLSRRGAPVSFFRAAGSAFYLQRVYRKWCAEQARSPGWTRWVIPLAFTNWYASLAAVIVLALSQGHR